MVHRSAKILSSVISAIKNLRELKGSTSQEILRYISSVYNIPSIVARRQIQKALKRGVAYGILKKADSYYSLPTDNEIAKQEVAVQEIGLLDLYCQRKIHRSRGGRARHNKDVRRRKVACRCSSKDAGGRSEGCGSRSCRRRRRGRCRWDSGRRVHDGTRPKIELSLDADKLIDKLTRSDQTTSGAMIGGIEQSTRSNMPSEQWDRSIPLSC